MSLQVTKGQALAVQGVVTGQPDIAAVAGATGVLSFDVWPNQASFTWRGPRKTDQLDNNHNFNDELYRVYGTYQPQMNKPY